MWPPRLSARLSFFWHCGGFSVGKVFALLPNKRLKLAARIGY
jgi:hypothetical protein